MIGDVYDIFLGLSVPALVYTPWFTLGGPFVGCISRPLSLLCTLRICIPPTVSTHSLHYIYCIDQYNSYFPPINSLLCWLWVWSEESG